MGAGRNTLGAVMAAAAVAAGGVLFAGCFGEGCDQANCSDGLFIEFGEGLASGNYRVVGSADSEPFACEWTESTAVCDVEWADLQVAAGAIGNPLLDGIAFSRTPETIELEVIRDGESIGMREIRPRYEKYAPNGEECGPVCRQSTVSFFEE